jgi:hypothetical protein
MPYGGRGGRRGRASTQVHTPLSHSPFPPPPNKLLQGISTVLLVDFVTVFHVIRPWFGLHTAQGLLHALGFQVAIVCIILSYLRAAMTDPGSVQTKTATDADIYPTQEGDPEAWMKMKRRYCHKCKCIKPPRAHHCSTCHRCINKMGESSPSSYGRPLLFPSSPLTSPPLSPSPLQTTTARG